MKNKPSDTVYISNLSYKRDRTGLKNLFTRYGKILKIKIIVEPKTEQSRGMAFVQMSSVKEAEAAIKGLHGQVIDGRTIKANYAIPQREEFVKEEEGPKKKYEKDLSHKSTQLMKKERNEKRRKSNPLVYKVSTKKKVAKKIKE